MAMNRTRFFERYARVVVSVGLNVQENQEVVISAPMLVEHGRWSKAVLEAADQA
jgi:leucyl aminopeptidase (aminopeptidase T)